MAAPLVGSGRVLHHCDVRRVSSSVLKVNGDAAHSLPVPVASGYVARERLNDKAAVKVREG